MVEHDNAGYPIAYCLLTTASSIDDQKRTKALVVFIRAVMETYGISPTFCHVDKDLGEIAALREVWPYAKISLCWWHLRRAVRTRLSNKKLGTTHYNPARARASFPFVDEIFRPAGQHFDIKDYEGGVPDDADIPIHVLHPGSNIPKLTIRVPPPTQVQTPTITEPMDATGAVDKISSGKENPEPTPPPERRVFCEPEYRDSIIAMMERHFCAHPLIPGYAPPSPDGIWRWAVGQMYNFCYKNGLAEVWAYMWENWYRRGRWELWARSAHSQIPVLKTTMILESQ